MTTMQMFSRAIVEADDRARHDRARRDRFGAALDERRARARAPRSRRKRQMRGQRVRFRVAPDGTVAHARRGGWRDRATWRRSCRSCRPTFPKGRDQRRRELDARDGAARRARSSARSCPASCTSPSASIRSTHGGDWAFVSMRGDVAPGHADPARRPGRVLEQGLVSGTMLVDQKRRWLTESWFNDRR